MRQRARLAIATMLMMVLCSVCGIGVTVACAEGEVFFINKPDDPTLPKLTAYGSAAREWDNDVQKLQRGDHPANTEIRNFVRAMLLADPDTIPELLNVCSADFFEISGGDGYTLIASLSAGRSCNDLEIFRRNVAGVTNQSIFGSAADVTILFGTPRRMERKNC